MQVRRLAATDAEAYWLTRNRGLAEFPDAFTTSHQEGLATTPATLVKRFGSAGSDNFMLGVFADDGSLAGHVGFERETRTKNRHKGLLVGMYVVPEYRGIGLGRQLVDTLVTEVRALDGVEQINLSVTHSNAGARGLYLACGFVSFGVEANALKVDGAYYAKEYMALSLV